MAQKIYPDAAAALDGLLFDGMTIAAGGFGLCGIPERLIDAIVASGVTYDDEGTRNAELTESHGRTSTLGTGTTKRPPSRPD